MPLALFPRVAVGQAAINELYEDGQVIAPEGTQEGHSDLHLVIDLDGNGTDEVLMSASRDDGTETPPGDFFIFGNNGNGDFTNRNDYFLSVPIEPLDSNARQITAADFNGDGVVDLLLEDHGHENECGPIPHECWKGGRNRLLLSDAQGTWDDVTDTHLPIGFSDFTHGGSAGDYDGDGDIDLWVNNLGAGWPDFPYLMHNNGSGVFTVAADFSWNSAQGLHIGPNLILPDENILTGGWSTSIDAEGDGDLDLLLGAGRIWDPESETEETWHLALINDGTGVFSRYPGNAWPRTICEASPVIPNPETCRFSDGPQVQQRLTSDLNGDGLVDVILKQLVGGHEFIDLLVSNPDETFANETESRLGITRGDSIGVLSLHDLDQDGHDDLFYDIFVENQSWASINLNDGEGNFRQLHSDWASIPSHFWVVLDADGDGGTDFLTARSDEGLVLHKMSAPYGPDLDGDEADNRLIGGAHDNHFRGFDGDDVLDSGLGNDILDGGPGNDTLIGGKGADQYRFRDADLYDDNTIEDKQGRDRVFFEGLDLPSVILAEQGPEGELILSFTSGGSLTIKQHFAKPDYSIEKLVFSSGTYDLPNSPAFDSGSIEELLSFNGFSINQGLNDAWFNPATNGQGFFIIVFPDIPLMFLAWFTYDTERPDEDVEAILGDAGHRWITAQGPFEGNTGTLDVVITRGGIFDAGDPAPENSIEGTMEVVFIDCTAGVIKYDIPGLGLMGEVPIQRIALDNVALCEALAAEN